MKNYISISCILFLCIASYTIKAQPNLDSLYQKWEDSQQADTSRALALSKYIDEFLYNDNDSAFLLSNRLIQFSKEINYSKGLSNGLNNRGLASFLMGNLTDAIKDFEASLDIHTKNNNKKGISGTLNNLGMVYNSQGNRPKALDYFIRSLKMDEELGDSLGVAGSYLNVGVVFLESGDFNMALEYLLPGLKKMEQIGNPRGMAYFNNSIASAYKRKNERSKALIYYHRSLQILKDHNPNGMAPMLNNVGSTYLKLNQLDSAKIYLKHSLALANKMSDQETEAHASIYLGQVALAENRPKLAVDYCSTAFDLGESIGSLEYHEGACDCLYRAYKELGNDEQALNYYEAKVNYADSLSNEENTKKLTQLEMQYEFDKKEAATQAEQEKKDAIAAQELKQQKLVRNGFMGGFTTVLLFAGVFFIQRNRIGKEKERSEELLLNILPEEVAEELKEKGHSDAQLLDQVTVLFTDFKGFTSLSERVTPKELVKDLHECFSAFDKICEKYDIEKIKTIGDAYMAAGGLPSPNTTHAKDVINAALEMADVIEKGKAKKIAQNLPFFEVRIGVHTGPVVAGIVGVKKFQYDIWGDTVNTASRMESSGEVGKVNISEVTYNYIKDDSNFVFESRGKINTKGKGEIEMFFVSKS